MGKSDVAGGVCGAVGGDGKGQVRSTHTSWRMECGQQSMRTSVKGAGLSGEQESQQDGGLATCLPHFRRGQNRRPTAWGRAEKEQQGRLRAVSMLVPKSRQRTQSLGWQTCTGGSHPRATSREGIPCDPARQPHQSLVGLPCPMELDERVAELSRLMGALFSGEGPLLQGRVLLKGGLGWQFPERAAVPSHQRASYHL